MEEIITYDIQKMKAAAGEAEALIRQIRQQLYSADQRMESEEMHRKIREIETICRGYEALITNLRAITNIYGSAAVAAAEIAAF